MKLKSLFLTVALLMAATVSFGQGGGLTSPMITGTSDPATCQKGREVYFSSTLNTVRYCIATNTWASFSDLTATQKGTYNYVADSGAANTYVTTLAPVPASLVAGFEVNFKATNANTGASTLNVNGLGAVNILKNGVTALVANDIKAGQLVSVKYDGTSFQMVSQLGNAAQAGTVTASPQFQVAIYPNAGTVATVAGIAGLTTDASGNLNANSLTLGSAPPTACSLSTGCFAGGEGSTAVTPAASVDTMRADSTLHGFKCSLNNAAEVACNPELAGDLGGTPASPTVVGLHVAVVLPYAAGAGAVNVMTAAPSPALTSLVTGQEVRVLANLANTTTTPTLNVNGLGAKTIVKNGSSVLSAGDITTTIVATFLYDGTNWQLRNPQIGGGGISGFTAGFFGKGGSGGTSVVPTLCDEGITTTNWVTCTDTGGLAAVAFKGTGSGAGAFISGAGADNCVSFQPANSACWEAPATITTSYHGLYPATPSTGIPHYSFSSPTITETISLIGVADFSNYVAGAGSVNVLTAALSPASVSNAAGTTVFVLPNLANTTTTPTLNVNGVGAMTITKVGTAALAAGDLSTTAVAELVSDGTHWQLLNPQTGAGGNATSVNSNTYPASAGFTSGGLACFTSTSAEASSALLAAGHILLGGGAGVCPTSDANLDDGQTTATVLTYSGAGGLVITGTKIALSASAPACVAGTAGALCLGEGTAFTNVTGTDGIYADNTAHELFAKTNGSANAGMLSRVQPTPIHATAQTAAITTATLCASAAGACNVAGQYNIDLSMYNTGTACSSVGSAAATPSLTWTDSNGTAHTAVPFPMITNVSATASATSFIPTVSALTAWASGGLTISTNGSVIQYAVGYTGCTTGTFAYQLDASVTRLQ